MMPAILTDDEKKTLLRLAREALEQGVRGQRLPRLDAKEMPPRLMEQGASFVTLTESGELRGCIGALEAYQPLAEDVREHAVAAALEDYRFPQVQVYELPRIQIEVSYLTPQSPLEYADWQDLLVKLHPGQDGVVLRDGVRRATFLPQVWEKIPDPALFLAYLCEKMGAAPDLWKRKRLSVSIYHVEEFHE